jgi:hypothetical protein
VVTAYTCCVTTGGVPGEGAVLVTVGRDPSDDDEELAALTDLLRAELLALDVDAVDRPTGEGPEGAKGVGTLIGLLAVHLRGVETLRSVLGALRTWAARGGREVEVRYGDEVLRVTGATREQQERLVDAWLARHAAGP